MEVRCGLKVNLLMDTIPFQKPVYQYHGCYWHGCPKCYPDRKKIIDRNDVTREEKHQDILSARQN